MHSHDQNRSYAASTHRGRILPFTVENLPVPRKSGAGARFANCCGTAAACFYSRFLLHQSTFWCSLEVGMRQFLNQFGRPAAGLLLCAGLALVVALFAAPHPWRATVPLAFAVVIVLLAARYCRQVALYGSIAAALIFASVLYQPLGSVRVENHAEKSSIGWMLLSSIALSYLLLPG